MRRALLVFLFIVSGAAALCYEVAWTRHLVLAFGNTTRAVALLLGAWMLGLALGAEVGGRLADRTKRPAVLYAVFELAIAAFALAFPWLVDLVRAVYLGIGVAAPPVLFALAFVVLVIPTFCMGTTLPLLARATVTDPARTGQDIGMLYAANIVGAVLGAAGTGFLLMESAGVLGSTQWAAAANVAVGVVGWLAFRRSGEPRGDFGTAPDVSASEPLAPEASAELDAGARLRRAALASAFVGGFVGLAAQVLWTRLLTFFLQGFTWTFTAILATFLTGLALGGFVFGRLAGTVASPLRLLCRLHLFVAVTCAYALYKLGDHYDVTRSLWEAAGELSPPNDLGTRHRIMLVLASGAVLLIPAFFMGGCFPVAAAIFGGSHGTLGKRVGRLYAVNTVGCVLGSLIAGFLLQPVFGPSVSAAIVAGTALFGALLVAFVGRAVVPYSSVVAIGVCGAFLWFAHPAQPFILRSHAFAGSRAREVKLLSEKHGEVCTVSVVENTRERFKLLYTDEFEAAGTKPEYRYMRMLAHLPVALAADPSRALVICFGTGTTAGSVAAHSAVKELDIVEISQEVLDTADQFADVNHDVLHGRGRSDLVVRVHVDDGRHFVLRSKETWGVITLEPLMPYTPAAIHFYTEDFYRTCADRLAPGGLMCQWIPLQGMSGDDFRGLVSAFVAVYPDSAMFFVDGAVALIGGPGGVSLSWPRFSERLADLRVADDLRRVGFADPARALATYVSGGRDLLAFAKGAAPVTDEFPVLEFHPIPPGVALPWLGQNLEHMRSLASGLSKLPIDYGALTGTPAVEKLDDSLFISLKSGSHVLDGLVRIEVSSLLMRQGKQQDAVNELQGARESLGRAVALDPGNETARASWEGLEREWWTIAGTQSMDRRDYSSAERQFRRALEFHAQRQADVVWSKLAQCRNQAERYDVAVESACEAVRLFPGGSDGRAERAFARSALGDVEGAASDYLWALAGADTATLPPRLRVDAERALGGFPSPRADSARAPSRTADFDGDLAARGFGKLTPRLLHRILAADDGGTRYVTELLPPDPAVSDADVIARLATLSLAGPRGADEAALAWLQTGRPAAIRAAAETLGRADSDVFASALVSETEVPIVRELARAAAWSRRRGTVMALLSLMSHDDAEVRRHAQRSLFTIVGTQAPGLDTLDTSDGTAMSYRRRLLDLRAWWARAQDDVDLYR